MTRSRYCYLEPDYPTSGFIATLFLVRDNLPFGMLPLIKLHRTLDELMTSIKPTVEQALAEEGADYTIPDTAILTPVSFLATYPLKKEYWDHSTYDYDPLARFRAFLPMLNEPWLYKMLVLPNYYDYTKRWHLAAVIPMLQTVADTAVETFMQKANFPTDPRARSAAFYEVGNGKCLNWKTGEIGDSPAACGRSAC
jgi:hypothetical protein